MRGKKDDVVSEDDHATGDAMEILEKLPPSFKKDGIVQRGMPWRNVDGARPWWCTREEDAKGWVEAEGADVSGRRQGWIRDYGDGPVPSSQKALKARVDCGAEGSRGTVNGSVCGAVSGGGESMGLNRARRM